MNYATRQIMTLLKIDAETATKVQSIMQIDFSECTTRQFNAEARFAFAVINDDVENINYRD